MFGPGLCSALLGRKELEVSSRQIKCNYHIFLLRGMQPTHQNRLDPTEPTKLGQFLVVGGLGWVMEFFLIADRVGRGS